jgi:hypothetical protein
MKEKDIIKMIHEIRVKHYEEIKNLTTGELILKIRKEADVVEQKLLYLKKQNRKIHRGLRSKI